MPNIHPKIPVIRLMIGSMYVGFVKLRPCWLNFAMNYLLISKDQSLRGCPTAEVGGGWGEKSSKTRRVPAIWYTLCWAPYFILRLLTDLRSIINQAPLLKQEFRVLPRLHRGGLPIKSLKHELSLEAERSKNRICVFSRKER